MPLMVQLQGYKSSGEQTVGTVAIKASAGMLGGFSLYDASEDASIILYDDPDSADGTVLLRVGIDFDTGHFSMTETFPAPIMFSLGCTLVLAGTNAKACIYYR